MKLVTLWLLVYIFTMGTNVFTDDKNIIDITEICFENGIREFPSWIEIKNISGKPVSLQGYQIREKDKINFEFQENDIIKPGEYLLLSFYQGNTISEEFEKSLPAEIRNIKIFNSKTFEESKELPNVDRYKISKKEITDFENTKFNSSLIKIGEEVELSNVIQVYLYSNKIIQEKEQELYAKYNSIALEYCKNNNISEKCRAILIYKLYTDPLFIGEIGLFDKNGNLCSAIVWGKEILSETQLDQDVNKEKVSIIYVKRRGESVGDRQYLGFVKDRHSFLPVLDLYDSSPGTEQCIRPFKDLKLDLSFDVPLAEKDIALKLDFHPFYFPIKPWDCEFEIASDKDFQKILYSKKTKPANFLALRRIYFNILKDDFENMTWNKELHYRARRILPDGYKTEWVGGDCSNIIKKYSNHIEWLKEKTEMDKNKKEPPKREEEK